MSINEGASCTLGLTFKDENGTLVVPDSATYKINEFRNKTVILDETDMNPTASTHDLEITGEQNAIIDQSYETEKHEVTVSFIYSGGDKVGKNSHILEIKNLRFIP